ncbi:MAG: hypothetical protein K2N41_05550 [Lachnospiraceae bacterium]|nr:hypothetical protein [Lachnospiraceae bacterium]
MNKLDSILESLMKKHALYFEDIQLPYYIKRAGIIRKTIADEMAKCGKDKVLAFRGGGVHTSELLKTLWQKGVDINFKYIIDKNPKESVDTGISYILPDAIGDYKIDIIVISSYKHRRDMLRELQEADFRGEIIDIYDMLEKHDIYLDAAFYVPQGASSYYIDVYYGRKKYEDETDPVKRELLLRRLIGRYLVLRDFVYAHKFIEMYTEEFGGTLTAFWEELLKLLSDIRHKMTQKSTQDIIVFWVDQLRYKDVERMKCIREIADHAKNFKFAYTQNLQTSTTIQTIFSGRDLLDEKAYLLEVVDEETSPLYRFLKKNEYDFKYMGEVKNSYFAEINTYSSEIGSTILPFNLWRLVCDLLDNDRNAMYIVQTLEAHEHHYCGYVTDIYNDISAASYDGFVRRYEECVDYIDQQFAFYYPLLDYGASKIIMSDHGQELENVYKFDEEVNPRSERFKIGRWSEDSIHVVLMVDSPYFEAGTVNGMFSLVQFSEIIESVINKKWQVTEHEFIKIQSMPYYSACGLKKIRAARDYKFGSLVKGIHTKDKKYLRYADGHEEFYLKEDEENNLIDDSNYQEDVSRARNLCGEIDMSIFQLHKFEGAAKLQAEMSAPFSSVSYWEKRYRRGGNSGSGSYNHLAEFKAEVLNTFIAENSVKTIVEWGCGDGNQLKLLQVEAYTGYDVSQSVINKCKRLYETDEHKRFIWYDSARLELQSKYDMAISLDVLYHLVEDNIFEDYLWNLFSSAEKYVVIYATDKNIEQQSQHVKFRKFTDYISCNFSDWNLTKKVENKYPWDANNPNETSQSDFFFYTKC